MHYHSEALIRDLSAKAQQFRIEVLNMVYDGQTGHIGGAFSAAEILAALYFHHLKIDPRARTGRSATGCCSPRATPARCCTALWPTGAFSRSKSC